MINRSEIMKKAHAAARLCADSDMFTGRTYAELFATQLRKYWGEAKIMARPVRPVSKADAIRAKIETLHNKDRWDSADRRQMDALNAESRAA